MTKFDVQAEERADRLARKRRQAFDEELLLGLATRTHAESVRDFFEILGCLDAQKERIAVYERKTAEYAY